MSSWALELWEVGEISSRLSPDILHVQSKSRDRPCIHQVALTRLASCVAPQFSGLCSPIFFILPVLVAIRCSSTLLAKQACLVI